LLKPASGGQAEYRGWFRVLVENHFLFDVLTLDSALDQPWGRYRLLVLPAIPRLSNELVQALEDFVASGGKLVASGQSGFQDGRRNAQLTPDLKCLGIEAVQAIRGDMRSSYFQVPEKTLFPRLAETDLVYLDGLYVYARYTPETQSFLQLVPPHNFGPPERCYFEQVTEHPAFILNPYGRGQAFYLPWLPGTQFYQHGQLNTARFMADLLQHVAGIPPLSGNLPAQVEATLMQNAAGSLLLHLVNTSGHFGNTYYAPLTLANLEVVLPWRDEPPAEVLSLVSGQPLLFTLHGESLRLHLPPVVVFEAVRITPPSSKHSSAG
jgi:hypothetical protein